MAERLRILGRSRAGRLLCAIAVLAFKGGRGTASMVRIAKQMQIPVLHAPSNPDGAEQLTHLFFDKTTKR